MIQRQNMRMYLIAALTCGICALAPLSSIADEESHREALETLLEFFDMEESAGQSLDQMVALHMQQNPQLGPYKDVLKKFYAKHMAWEKLKEELIGIYMEEFSEEEVRDLIAFYKTPTGRKAIQRMPALMSKCALIGSRRLRKKMPEWNRMLQEKTERLRQLQEGEEASTLSDKQGSPTKPSGRGNETQNGERPPKP